MIYIDKERCNGCGECLSICPVGAISLQGDKAFIDESLCKSCDACLSVCSGIIQRRVICSWKALFYG